MPSSLSRGFSLRRLRRIAADPDVRFSPWIAVSRMQAMQASADRGLAGNRIYHPTLVQPGAAHWALDFSPARINQGAILVGTVFVLFHRHQN
jgi:hypothetical protein